MNVFLDYFKKSLEGDNQDKHVDLTQMKFYCHYHHSQFKDSLSLNDHLNEQHYFRCSLCNNKLIFSKDKITYYANDCHSLTCSHCSNVYFFSKGEKNQTEEAIPLNNPLNVSICQIESLTIENHKQMIEEQNHNLESIKVSHYESKTTDQFEIVNEIQSNLLQDEIKESKQKMLNEKVIITEVALIKKHQFIQNNDLSQHSTFKCQICFKTFKTDIDRRNHELAHETKCLQCHKEFMTQYDYVIHCKYYHSYYCTLCKKKWDNAISFELHYMHKHLEFINKEKNKNDEQKGEMNYSEIKKAQSNMSKIRKKKPKNDNQKINRDRKRSREDVLKEEKEYQYEKMFEDERANENEHSDGQSTFCLLK